MSNILFLSFLSIFSIEYNDCYQSCGATNIACLCECIFEKAEELRANEKYDLAVKHYQAVDALCPEKNALALVDTIYENHRIWLYRDGAFALATPLGEPITEFKYQNPEPFKNGHGICSDEYEKYILINSYGMELNLENGYEGIIYCEGNTYLGIDSRRNERGYRNYHVFKRNRPIVNKPFSYYDKMFKALQSNLPTKILTKYHKIKRISEGLTAVELDGLWGFINNKGEVVIELKYNDVLEFSEDLAAVELDGLWGGINKKGDKVIEFEYDYVDYFTEGFSVVKKNDKFGFINRKGEVVIQLKYDDALEFSESRAAVSQNEFWGYIDTSGMVITPLKYNDAMNFVNGWGQVRIDGLDVFVNCKGEEIGRKLYQKDYEDIFLFSDYCFGFKLNGLWGFKDKKGELLVAPKYQELETCLNGMCLAKKNGQWEFINEFGVEVLSIENKDIEPFWKGYARFTLDNYMGIIDTNYQIIVPPIYEDLIVFDGKENAAVKRGGYWGIVNKLGQEVVKPIYEGMDFYKPGVATVWNDEKSGLINVKGDTIFSLQYDDFIYHNGKVLAVKDNGFWQFTKEETGGLFPQKYNRMQMISESYLLVDSAGLYGIFNLKKKKVSTFIYSNIYLMSSKFIPLKKGKLWGVIDLTGKTIIPFKYDNISGGYGGNIILSFEGLYGIRNLNNQIVLPFTYKKIRAQFQFYVGIDIEKKHGVFNRQLQPIIPFKYDSITILSSNIIAVRQNEFWGLFNKIGEQIKSFKYLKVKKLKNKDYIGVFDGNSWMEIDSLGRIRLPNKSVASIPITNNWYSYVVGRDRVKLKEFNGKQGLIFESEQSYIPPIYDDIRQIYDEWLIVLKNGKWGWVNHSGQVMIPCRYDAVTPFDEEGKAWVFQFGKRFQIDKDGDLLWDSIDNETFW